MTVPELLHPDAIAARYCEVARALISPVPGEAQQKEEQVDKVQIK